LAAASFVICTYNLTARRFFAFNSIDSSKVVVAVPGVDTCKPSPEHVEGDWRFLSVGAVVPRKRYELIIDALATLPDRHWQWTVVGNVTRYPAYVAALRSAVRRHGLDSRVELAGEVDDIERLWREAHIFLLSSTHEGYGMAVAEALAHGVPTITTMAGAVADWASDAVILVRSDDPAEMAASIADIRNNRSNYLAARNRALSFGKTLPSWDESLRHAVDRIRSLAAG
jgi:glycosyltransferase involved in cell wall biosynthesis